MFKLSGLVLAATLTATLAAGLAPTGAEAQSRLKTSPNGGSNPCMVLCVQIPPRDCPPRQLQPVRELVINVPPALDCPTSSKHACDTELGNLRRVTVNEINRVDDRDAIHLVPLCDTIHRSLTEQEVAYITQANVQGLVRAIAHNRRLMAGLADGGYTAKDVLGVVMGKNLVTLYVNHRH